MRIALLTATFPPQGGSGVQRPYYQFKHLRELGNDVWVIGATDAGWVSDDTFPLSKEDEKQIIRIPLYRSKLDRRLRTRLSKWTGCIPFPDRAAGWGKRAFTVAKRLIEKENIDVILTSVGYSTMLQLGAKLKKASKNTSLVVDFRDLLTSNPICFDGNPYKNKFAKPIHAWAENRWMRMADAACAVSQHHANLISERNPGLKVRVVQNGFGDSKYLSTSKSRNQKYTFRYTGFVHPSMKLDSVFKAIALMQSEMPNVSQKVTFEFFTGNPAYVSKLAKVNGIEKLIDVQGYVSHERVLELQSTADALLLLWTPDPGCMCGKMYEYLKAGPPILAISQGNVDGAFVVESTSRGLCCKADDIQQMKTTILQFVSGNDNCLFDLDLIQTYSRSHQNKLLNQMLLEITDSHAFGRRENKES